MSPRVLALTSTEGFFSTPNRPGPVGEGSYPRAIPRDGVADATTMCARDLPDAIPPAIFALAPVSELVAITDLGRPIPLFRYETVVLAAPDQRAAFHAPALRAELLRRAELEFLQKIQHAERRFSRVASPSLAANCHGWVFAGGHFAIEDQKVPAILAENGYRVVREPREGDLAICTRDGQIVHSGCVRSVGDDTVLVESKWGPFGVFSHPAECHPYDDCTFYRSRRSGHSVLLKSA